MSRKILKLYFSLVVLLFLSINGHQTSYSQIVETKALKTPKQMTISLPFTISDDEDFLYHGFQGSGTESDPYLIENFAIEDDTNLSGISVENTTKYFVIRNCFINNLKTGIHISNIGTETGYIFNNTIYDCNNAIVINKTSSLRIQNNQCNTSSYYGIALFESDNCIISYNMIYWSRLHGIFLHNNSSNNIIHHNFFVINNCKIYHAYPYYAWPQAADIGFSNVWFDAVKLEGNYWEDWSGRGGYYIDGTAYSQDPYPYRDLDGDLLDDYREMTHFGTNHLTSDSDQDDLNDREEIYNYYTYPLINDSDEDGYLDGEEVFLGTDPLDKNDHPGVQEASYVFVTALLAILASSIILHLKERRKKK